MCKRNIILKITLMLIVFMASMMLTSYKASLCLLGNEED